MKIIARPWQPQDLIDDLQSLINEEPDNYLNTRRSTLCMARDFLKEHFAESGWIPVTERLPKGNKPGEISENVIVRTTDGEVTTGWLDALGSDKWWLVIGTDDSHTCWGLGYVTHWMPLPQPPKGE